MDNQIYNFAIELLGDNTSFSNDYLKVTLSDQQVKEVTVSIDAHEFKAFSVGCYTASTDNFDNIEAIKGSMLNELIHAIEEHGESN